MKEPETQIIAAYIMGMVSFICLVVSVLLHSVFYLTSYGTDNEQQRQIEMLQTQVSIMERQIDVVKIKEKEG